MSRTVRCSGRWGALVVVVLGALVFGAVPALAARGHVYERSFGGPGTGAGQLQEPAGVAVNEALGRVYVADQGNDRVQFFDERTGVVEGEFNGSGSLSDEGGLAAGGGALKGAQVGEGEEVTGRFSEPKFIAVDNSCWQHKPKLTETTTPKCGAYDPSYGDVYVVDAGHDVVDKFTESGEYVAQISNVSVGASSGFLREGVKGVAVSRDGNLMVAVREIDNEFGVFVFSDGVHNAQESFRFVSTNPSPTKKGFTTELGGLAAGPGGEEFYAAVEAGLTPVVALLSVSEGVLNEEVFAGLVDGLGGESCTGDVYLDEGTLVQRLGDSDELLESLSVPGGVPPKEPFGVGGVASDCSSQSLFVGNAATGEVEVFGPEPPGPPTIEPGSTSVSGVTGDSASFSATVNPRSETFEDATEYRFEYGRCVTLAACSTSGYEHSAPDPDGRLAANYEPDLVGAEAQGLVAGSAYHYRLFARNARSAGHESEGEEGVFVTQRPGSFVLPDDRGWELVSPPDKYGAELYSIGEGALVQAAANGDAISYPASAATESEPVGAPNEPQVLSVRGGGGGWSSLDISMPNEAATGPEVGAREYYFFTSDLSSSLVAPLGGFDPAISAEASERTPYLRSDFGAGDPQGICSSGCYRPLVTGAAGYENVPPGTEFGEHEEGAGVFPRGVSPDLRHVVLGSYAALEEGAPSESLYEWSAGRLRLVSVLPDHLPMPTSGGSAPVLGYNNDIVRGAVSADGSHVVWSEKKSGGHLYVRDVELGETVQVDAVQEGASGAGFVEPVFQFASPDGSRVFFTDTQRLTSDSHANENEGVQRPDLYECEVFENEAGGLACRLSDLTPGSEAEPAAVQGDVIGASEDDSAVYFVADGVLASNTDSAGQQAVKGNCNGASSPPGALCNVYVDREGAIALVAVISGEDYPDWAGVSGGPLKGLTARVSPDGEWLAFMSSRSLTGYDNRDVAGGKPDEEVFLYHASGAAGGLVCASCDPTGARPHGIEYAKLNDGLAGGDRVWPFSTWIAANVPGWTEYGHHEATYQSRYLSNEGRLFFDSGDGLVAQDTNEAEDVYEYEPPRGGGDEPSGDGCTSESATYSPVSEGCVDLISSGAAGQEAGFLDASESGDDVFFMTAAQLSKRDTDTSRDVYDARVGGGEVEPARPVECAGDSCLAPVIQPQALTPNSLSYSGPGNMLISPLAVKAVAKAKPVARARKLARALAECRKARRKGRRKVCEKQARARYGTINNKAKRRRK